jgi:hypothetical protein
MATEIPKGPWRWIHNGGSWLLVTDHSGQKFVLGTLPPLDDGGHRQRDVLATRGEDGFLVELTPDSPLGRALRHLPDLLAAAQALQLAAVTGRLRVDAVYERAVGDMERALDAFAGFAETEGAP